MLQQQKFLVIGSGVTGLAVVKFLHQHNLNFAITDSRQSPPNLQIINNAFPEVVFTYGQLVIPSDTTTIIVSPGVALTTPEIVKAKKSKIKIWSEIELFAHFCNKPIIAITGSNGKSTVTTLIADILLAAGFKVGVGGNLGVPAIELLDEATQYYVLELSSYQLETTYSLQPLVSLILNITPDHMDRYNTFADYVSAKHRVFNNAKYKVYNRADSYTKPMLANPDDTAIYSFGTDVPDNSYQSGMLNGYLMFAGNKIIHQNELPLLGEHNLQNVLAALTVVNILAVEHSAQITAIKEFVNLEHRCELVKINHASAMWINDSKGTNVGATIAAIVGLQKQIAGKWILILGGVGKDADFSPLLAPITQACKLVILFGQVKDELYKLFNEHCQCIVVTSLNEVVDTAHSHLTAGDGVLFSPACASFDMFLDYVDRGRQFKSLVQAKYQD
jgi:UDP-N-acetylmuramoylalanine--D-glutamate ligase